MVFIIVYFHAEKTYEIGRAAWQKSNHEMYWPTQASESGFSKLLNGKDPSVPPGEGWDLYKVTVKKDQIDTLKEAKKALKELLEEPTEDDEVTLKDQIMPESLPESRKRKKKDKDDSSSIVETTLSVEKPQCEFITIKDLKSALEKVQRKSELQEIIKRLENIEKITVDGFEEILRMFKEMVLHVGGRDEFFVDPFEQLVFPIPDAEISQNFNIKLKGESELKPQERVLEKQIIAMLKLVGGNNYIVFLRAALNKFYTDDCMSLYSLHGFAKKLSFEDLELFKILKRYILTAFNVGNPCPVTEKQVEAETSRWLAQAPARAGKTPSSQKRLQSKMDSFFATKSKTCASAEQNVNSNVQTTPAVEESSHTENDGGKTRTKKKSSEPNTHDEKKTNGQNNHDDKKTKEQNNHDEEKTNGQSNHDHKKTNDQKNHDDKKTPAQSNHNDKQTTVESNHDEEKIEGEKDEDTEMLSTDDEKSH